MPSSPLHSFLDHLRFIGGNPRKSDSDGSLLDQYVRQADEQAFTVLMRRYGPLVWSACRRVTKSEQDAEDVFQATFMVLARKASTIRRQTAVGSWLFGVAYKLACRANRANARRQLYEKGVVQAVSSDPLADISLRELQVILDEELARLPDKNRAPLLLCYFEGLTQDEAATRLGWTKRSVKDRLERGRDRLRSRLNRRGVTLSAALSGSVLAAGAYSTPVRAAVAVAALRAALAFGVRQPLTGLASVQALALAKGGLKAMFVTKLATICVGVLATAVLAGAGGFAGVGLKSESINQNVVLPQFQPMANAAVPIPQAEKKPQLDLYGDPLPQAAVLRLGTTRYRIGGLGFDLPHLAFSLDGKTLVSASHSAIQFWDPITGRLLRELTQGKLSIECFALSPDGRHVATGGLLPIKENVPWEGGIEIWDVATGKEVRTTKVSDGRPSQLAFTPDGKHLVSLTRSFNKKSVLRVSEVATGNEITQHLFPDDSGTMALSADGSMLAIISGPNTRKLYLWKWKTGVEPRELKASNRVGMALAFSPDGKVLVECLSEDDGLRLWDVARGNILQSLKSPEPLRDWFHAVFSADGKTLFASGLGNDDGAIHTWDTTTWKFRKLMATHVEMRFLAISPDSRLLAAVGDGLRVWEIEKEKELSANDDAHHAHINMIAVSEKHVVTAADDRTVRLWDAVSGKHQMKLTHGSWVRAIALSPDGNKIVSSSLDNSVCLWEVATGQKLHKLAGHGESGGARAVRFTRDGRCIVSWGDDMFLRKWDVATGKVLAEHLLTPGGIRVGDMPGAMRGASLGKSTFSPDGKTFVLPFNNEIHVFYVDTGRGLFRLPTEGGIRVASTAISPDNRLLLTCEHGKQVETVFADGTRQYSVQENYTICLWELATLKMRKKIVLPEGTAGPVAFSPDSKMFAVAPREPDRRIRFWSTADGQELKSIQGYRGNVTALAFTPDGTRLITAMDDTTALVWDLNLQTVID